MLGILSILIVVACIGFLIYFDVWSPSRPVKSQVAICAKCKYAVKTRWGRFCGRLQDKFRCRTPDDPTPTDFVTGVVSKPTFTCDLRNAHGRCVNYKKVWWRR